MFIRFFCSLENKKADMWGDVVTIHYGDMREWNPSEKADIIISELLGSFGDNELSPECLDGAQKCLKGNCAQFLLNLYYITKYNIYKIKLLDESQTLN